MLRIIILFLVLSGGALADEWNIKNLWAEPEGERKVPRVKPYELPRFGAGYNEGDHHTQIPPLQLAPYVDGEGIFYAALNCFPEKSKFRLELDLEGRYSTRTAYDLTDGQELGQYYGAIVARVPLYSATELSREREREYIRRTATAEAVGALMQALAERNHALRELGLYTSLEARSQVRVLQGVADVNEQVGHLNKVASAQKNLIMAETNLVRQRLMLIGQCADDKADHLNGYIKNLTKR